MEKEEIRWYLRPFFYFQKKRYGAYLRSSMIWAKSPLIFLGISFLFGILERRGSSILPEMRSLILVRISQLNGCSFCIDLNSSVLLKRSISMEKLEALSDFKNSDLFTDQEKDVLSYAEVVTLSKGPIPEIHREVLSKYYTSKQITELTALIAFQNMSTKFNNAFGIESQGFCKINK